jgi:hypothetical protein
MRKMSVKSLFKKELALGTIWNTYNHLDKVNLVDRPVSIVQTNAVAFKSPRGDSWLRFDDKTATYTNPAPGFFQIYDNDYLVLTYERQNR